VLPVSEPIERSVFKAYGIERPPPGAYEIDHLISLDLGGSNDPRNLWPEPVTGLKWNARVKDSLEKKHHDEVCRGSINLTVAQQAIAGDWIAAYKKYFHTDRPVTHRRRAHLRRHHRTRK
jgi:hypothetical protein